MRAFTLVALLALACFSQAHADERILSYASTITVQPDGSLSVHETIRVRAEGARIRRGIYRDFPTVYPGRDGRQFVVGFNFQSAQRDGSPEEWRTENRGNGVRVYLGRASYMLPRGEHTYDIEFRTDRQLGFFSAHDELYWNVTGNGWDFPIDTASARVRLPAEVPQAEIRMEAYTGPQGAKGNAYVARLEDGVPSFATTGRLGQREGLTIVVMWPKGFVTPQVENAGPGTASISEPGSAFSSDTFRGIDYPPAREDAVITDQRPALYGIGGLALLLIYYVLIWNWIGRDPPGRIPIPEYEPPPGITPGAMRYLTEMGYDDRCFAADVLNLAVKGHLVVEEEKAGLFGLKKEFTLVKQMRPDTKPLSAEEYSLLTKLFSLGTRLELKQSNHQWVNGAKTLHKKLLKGRFQPSFFRINGGWHALGILWSILVLLSLFASANFHVRPEWYVVTPLGLATSLAVVVGLIANGVFGKLLKAPTVAGRAIMDRIRGFKMYLEVAEGEDLERVTTPPPPLTPELYHAYLPAALGLGVEQNWGERFARVFAEQAQAANPAWYSGSSWDSRHLGSFSSSLGNQLNGAISSASTAPGSSSGGGGGGSSGGGGGGGGGGGW